MQECQIYIMQLAPKKISIPESGFLINRARLQNRLEKTGKPLVWVTAKPGSGKTSLVAAWIKTAKKKSIWYNIDNRDNCPETFLHYLNLAVREAGCFKDFHYDSRQIREYPDKVQCLLDFFHLLFQHLTTPVVFVFDDLHHLPENSTLHEIMAQTAKALPAGVKFVILGHTAPPKSYVSLQAYDLIEEIREEDLAFTSKEAAQMIETTTAGMNAETVENIRKATGGWATGIILYANQWKKTLWAKQNETPNVEMRPENIDAYFDHTIYRHFSQEMRIFVLTTSLLPCFQKELAAHLLPDLPVESMITTLAKNHMFLEARRLPSGEIIYSYHQLFQNFLIKQGKNELKENQINEIKRQAAIFFLSSGFIEEAAFLYRDIDDQTSLTKLLSIHAAELNSRGRPSQVCTLFQALSDDIFESNPSFYYHYGIAAQPHDFIKSHQLFTAGFKAAEKLDRTDSQFLCWAEIVNTISWSKDESDRLHAQVEWLQNHKQQLAKASREIQISVVAALLLSAIYHFDLKIDHSYWQQYAIQLVQKAKDSAEIIALCMGLFSYSIYYSQFHVARYAIETIQPKIERLNIGPVKQTYWLISSAWYHYTITGNMEAGLKDIEQALDAIARYEVSNLKFEASFCSLLISFCLPSSRPVKEQIREFSELNCNLNAVNRMRFNVIFALHSIYDGNLKTALAFLKTALAEAGPKEQHEKLHAIYLNTFVLFELGNLDEARKEAKNLKRTIESLQNSSSDYFYDLICAYMAANLGDDENFNEAAGNLFRFLKVTDPFCLAHLLPKVGIKVFTETKKRGQEPKLSRLMLDKIQNSRKFKGFHSVLADKNGKQKNKAVRHPAQSEELQHIVVNMKNRFETDKIYKDSQITLQALAEKMNTSRNNLSRILNEELHINFYDLLRKYRIQDAIALLTANAEMNILQVAHEVGFNNKATFNQSFKQETGLTPKEYRKKHNTHLAHENRFSPGKKF